MWFYKMNRINTDKTLNALKVVLAAIGAIIIAEQLELNYSISAGIVAILTIQPTKKETIATALGRFYAFLVALFIAYICFFFLGFHISAFMVYLVVYVFICQIFNWYNALTLNSVLISHFVAYGCMDVTTLKNEILIFIIGVSIGVLANLHLRKRVDYIEKLKKEADEQIIEILSRMSERIMNNDMTGYNDTCFLTLKKQIREAKNVADANYKNQFKKDDIYDIEYILMRDRQCHILYEMYKNVRTLNSQPSTAKKISDFMKLMSEVFDKENNGIELMEQFKEMDVYMKSRPLPIVRKEFEDRARLFVLMRNIEEFIQIKIDFMNRSN